MTSLHPVADTPTSDTARSTGVLRRALRTRRMKIGLALTGIVLFIALAGPFLAPHAPVAFVDMAYAPPSDIAWLGTDYVGRDVLSRVLNGGRGILVMSVLGVSLAMLLGATVGMVAAYSKPWVDSLLMRAMDVIFSIPNTVLILLILTLMGTSIPLLVVLVGLVWMPSVSRITRGSALQIVRKEFVEAAEVIGISRPRILLGEVLPNIATPLLVEFGLRLTLAISLIAGISFLGFGAPPPTPDWGMMISENRGGLSIQPWGTIAPIFCIALFAIGTNMMTEALSRAIAGTEARAVR